MTRAQATLKSMVQCRSLWLWHLFGLCICTPAVLGPLSGEEYGGGAILSLLVVPLWSGVMSPSLAKDFRTKPFSFCVPVHQLVWRRALLTIGLVVAGLCSLYFLLLQAGETSLVVVRVWQAFWILMAVYMAGVLAITTSSNASFVPALISLLLVISLNDRFGEHIRIPVEQTLLANPAVTTILCFIVIIQVWVKLGSRNLARKYSGRPFMPLHSIWSSNKQAIYNAERKVRLLRKTPGAVMNAVEGFFLARMRAVSGHFTQQTLWGAAYVLIGRAAPARASNLVFGALALVVLTVGLGFMHPTRFLPGVSVANLVLYLVFAITAEYRINPHGALMLNISRKNRLRSLMWAGVVQLIASTVVCAFLISVSHAVVPLFDEVTFLGHILTYDPVIPRSLFLLMPMLPIFFICQILFPRNTVIPITVISVVAVTIFSTQAAYLLSLSSTQIVLLQLVGWLPFVVIVRHYCLFWDLSLDER